jgi:hypothetical protein
MAKKYDKTSLVRLTSTELEKIHSMAKKADLSISRYFVKSALSDGRVLTAEEKEEIKKLRFEIRKIGVNLNQITYALNASHHNVNIEEPTSNEIKAASKVVAGTLAKLLKLL